MHHQMVDMYFQLLNMYVYNQLTEKGLCLNYIVMCMHVGWNLCNVSGDLVTIQLP